MIFQKYLASQSCAYQGVRKVSFLNNCAYVINGWSHTQHLAITDTWEMER